MSESQIVFFAGRNSRDLAERIASEYGVKLGAQSFLGFSDGEFQPSFECSVRGKTVFLIQSTNPPSDNLFELLLMADAARRASAYKIVAVIPYFGWARQDRKDKSRVPIGARVVANLIEASSIDRVMTMDLHADQIQGFFNIPVDHLFSSWMFVPYIESLNMENLAFASPDIGGAKRASVYAKNLHCPLIICHKTRAVANRVENMTAIGDVEGKDVILVDDMVDTAGTITKAADMMVDLGAHSVSAIASHAVLSGPAYDRINASKLKELVVTDTIPLRADADRSKIRVLSVANLFADVIAKVFHNESISKNYVF
ncbi:MAG: ribose-phosphate pyrophosphokinase [Bacteroidia bacterium]|nr:MAG: ribose-phosphate pyrophosphokinase [Bacteroidia bacterium]